MKKGHRPHKPGSPGSSRREDLVEKAMLESLRAREREEKLRELRALFSSFGSDVMSHIASQFIRYGHLKNTLKLLNLTQPADLDAQRDLLLRHLELNGGHSLMQRLNASHRTGTSLDDTQPEFSPDARLARELDILDEAEKQLMSRVLQRRSATASTHLNDADTQILARTAAEPPTPPDEHTPAVERRSGQDRRQNQCRRQVGDRRRKGDRRQNVELIFNNKRFGKNRRSNKDRRAGHDRRSSKDRRKNGWTQPQEHQ
ncbi:MAG: hypothetical protein Kow0059_11160 [Candidatus Sumerlaeia bacterium]